MTQKNFWKMIFGKAALAAVLPLLCLAAAVPASAQTAEIRSTGVYYIDGTDNKDNPVSPEINDVYCNWGADTISEKGAGAYKSGIVNVEGHNTDDPWETSALIEYDQPYPGPNVVNKYPNHCLALCMDVYCTNKPNGATTYSIAFPIQNIMFEIVKYNKSAGVANPETNPAVHTIYQSILDNNIVDWNLISAADQTRNQAKFEYDKALTNVQEGGDAKTAYDTASQIWQDAQTAWQTAVDNYNANTSVVRCKSFSYISGGQRYNRCVYNSSCLTATVGTSSVNCIANTGCASAMGSACLPLYNEVYAAGTTLNQARSIYDQAYQDFKKAGESWSKAQDAVITAENAYNAAQTNFNKLISSSQDLSKYMCAAYSCLGATSNPETSCSCPNPEYECVESGPLTSEQKKNENGTETCDDPDYCCRPLNETGNANLSYYKNAYTAGAAGESVCTGLKAKWSCGTTGSTEIGGQTNCIVRSEGTGRGYNDPIRFCTSWDGSYEILGEFGKTNGQFGFRATVATDYPGDGIAIENINIEQTYPYPGNNQYPIQVDVTNVHTVRSTPSVVGEITGVQALPYSFAYRLSKDSDVKIQIYDASAQIPTTNQGDTNIPTDDKAELILAQNAVVRTLVDWQPRLGEGLKGSDSDKLIQESDQWDGRDDNGRLLPANNYLVSIQAKSQDEWPGTDFSRAVTRQMSVDPLKLTDIQVQGLNKQSTAYATVRYVPTEASTVYFEVYTPGTTFENLYTKGYQNTGTSPSVEAGSGSLVYRSSQQRGRSQSYPDKWDGLCHEAKGCTISYASGSKLPISGQVYQGDLDSCQGANGIYNMVTKNCDVTYANNAPMPDGDYVYVLWAEVPYTDVYYNGAACYQCSKTEDQVITRLPAGCAITWNADFTKFTCPTGYTATTNNATVLSGTFTGVKTQKYYSGILPVERGVVDITIQPVSYSTIGSSPTAYGLDPFIFKYSIAREATVEAEVQNTAGVTVKTLTDEGGNTNVAQQMNTLTWDGRDNQGRMVGPGTYMFVVKTKDPMFPQSIQTTASTLFPVDLYRVVDVSTTDVYGDSGAKATINYMLSKAMNVQINIYNKDVVLPVYTDTGETEVETLTRVPQEVVDAAAAMTPNPLPDLTAGTAVPTGVIITQADLEGEEGYSYIYTDPVLSADNKSYTYYRIQRQITNIGMLGTSYQVNEILQYTVPVTSWEPRVCNRQTDKAYFSDPITGYIDPTTNPQCIYVNDTTFTNYPANPEAAKYNYAEGAAQTLDVRLQPVKTFNRSALKAGDGVTQTEEWDAQYFYNPTPVSTLNGGKNTPEAVAACANQTDLKACPYEMIPDGTYPFYLAAKTEEPVNLYYNSTTAQPVRTSDEVTQQTGLYATDKTTYRVNITRGPVYFLDGSVAVYPNAPQLFNTSSGPVFVPPYEINFAISRAATVEVAIVALEDGLCTATDTPVVPGDPNVQMARAGDVCKYLSTMTIVNTPNFDPNVIRKIYWDGTDNNGFYVRNGNYEIRLTAKNYPDEGLYEPTVKQLTQNVDLLKVFDLPESEAYALNKRGTNMSISYQISVPMKVAIQIFKPGTTIYDYQKGTLRDPATGKEVTDIRDVLVRAIVGIRPATTLIEEIWDGTDYAQQDVPDGTYPFRFVTALQSADIDSITGEILNSDDQSTDPAQWSIEKVADTNQYVNLHRATVAIGDGEFVCEDWEKTVFFYPNPFKTPTGTMEITKLPVPGKMSFKLYNLAGDLVRESGYTCVDANNMSVVMGGSIDLSPDNTVSNTAYDGNMPTIRNAALRCFWDRTNQHGKKVARGVYFGLVDFRAQNGRQHCQKVVKILIPR